MAKSKHPIRHNRLRSHDTYFRTSIFAFLFYTTQAAGVRSFYCFQFIMIVQEMSAFTCLLYDQRFMHTFVKTPISHRKICSAIGMHMVQMILERSSGYAPKERD